MCIMNNSKMSKSIGGLSVREEQELDSATLRFDHTARLEIGNLMKILTCCKQDLILFKGAAVLGAFVSMLVAE
jgi:hypothetical protein